MESLDKERNGTIHRDGFEALVRLHRRTGARHDQLRKELPRGTFIVSSFEPSHHKILMKLLLPHRQAILNEARRLDKDDHRGTIPLEALIHVLRKILSSHNVDLTIIDDFIYVCKPVHGLIMYSDLEMALEGPREEAPRRTKRENKFLDHHWLTQFDTQMEKIRDLGF
jgi:hypothetical protein